MTKVYGSKTELNYYFVNLHVGKPLVKQSLIVDTGSQSKVIRIQIISMLKSQSQILQCDSSYLIRSMEQKNTLIGKQLHA